MIQNLITNATVMLAQGTTEPRLYHNPSSYYSMIARLALAEARIAYEPMFVDIHLRGSQQSPAYVRLNRNMTVPTLVLHDRVLDQSRAILEFALISDEAELDAETASWLDLHYSFPIEDLTFGDFLAHNALARMFIPARMAGTHRKLLRLAAAHPDLADAYQARAAVFAEGRQTFDPRRAAELDATRQAEAIELLDRLDRHLSDGRQWIVLSTYGPADVVWTVFLARMQFTGLLREIQTRPALSRYWSAMEARPSFAAADVWTNMQVGRLFRAILASFLQIGPSATRHDRLN